MSKASKGGNVRLWLQAYTDASIDPETGRGTGAVVFVNSGTLRLHSVHLLNYGVTGPRIHKPETDSKIAALHLAPKSSLTAIFSDSQGSVDFLSGYKSSIPQTNLFKYFKPEDVDFLNFGLRRQPRVQFLHMGRENEMMGLADHFSRYARMHEALHKFHHVSSRNTIERQKEILEQVLGTPS